MNTYYDPETKRWTDLTTLRLPRHDLYFGTPVNSPTAGIPLGDGDTGTLLWLEKDGVHLHVNKCDLWQDAPPGVTWDDACYCSGHEEELTCVKHAGEVIIRFNTPLFEYLYQNTFEARLCFTDACALVSAETPFGDLRLRAFAGAEAGVTALEFDLKSAEPEAPEVRLLRFGSRTLWRWYCQQKFTPEASLQGTQALADDHRMYITQDLGAVKFCIALSVLSGEASAVTDIKNSHCVTAQLQAAASHGFTLLLAVRTGDSVRDAKLRCDNALDAAERTGVHALYNAHARAWAAFWNRTGVAIENDYLENIYYFYLYCMNSESRGAYPPHFTSGLWGFYHDYVPWVYYFHYNLQHLYAPLDAAGHGELAQNYYDLRKNGLPTAILYAGTVKHKNGAFVHDVTDRYGRGADYDSLNCTPAAQIAMQMYRHWRFSGDDAFLKEYALPYMRAAALFYLDLLQKEADGLYHIHGTTAYEGNAPTDDTLTDLVMIQTLFTALRPFADQETQKKLDDVLQHLPPTLFADLEQGEDLAGDVFAYGIGKGTHPKGDGKVLGIGKREGVTVRKQYGDPESKKRGYGFPDIEVCSLYPAGLHGLKDKGTPLFDALQNDLLLHQPGDKCGHWNMLPVYLARMGMAEEAENACIGMLQANQGFINGFNAEIGEPGSLGEAPPAYYKIRNTDTDEITLLRPDDFIHFDFETAPILAQAVHDMLLQSHENCMRILPAAVIKQEIRFRLYAEGGFLIGAQCRKDGFIITVTSERGEKTKLILPGAYKDLRVFSYVADITSVFKETFLPVSMVNGDICLVLNDIGAGQTLLLTSVPFEELETIPPCKEQHNGDMKMCGGVCLGSPHLMRKTG